MRTPKYEDLSLEQDDICMLAPLDGASMVSGPPGTGKTVVAFYRAEAAAKKGQTPRVVMFNKVLNRYTENATKNKRVKEGVSTWHSWFYGWWKQNFGPGLKVPEVEPREPDWAPILAKFMQLPGTAPAILGKARKAWGHVIIDEGQDFAPDFYLLAAFILAGSASGSGEAQTPALTVMADDNQRLDRDRNSSLAQIRNSLCLPENRLYRLTKNYRNTAEIARAAAHFYCGLSTGIPQIPEGRSGAKPQMVRADDLNASVDFICRFVRNQSDLETGVFLPRKDLQKKYFNKLTHRLKESGVKVQRYTSGDDNFDAESLRFDRAGVTVLCDQSCKGLEFDAVFIPELQARSWDPAAIDQMKMQMYVLSSRARTRLYYLYSASKGVRPPILDRFPDPSTQLLEWIDG